MRGDTPRWAHDFQLGEVRYTARPVKGNLPGFEGATKHCLVTLLVATAEDLQNGKWLESRLQEFRDLKDDVWTFEFLDGLLITVSDPLCPSPSPLLTASLQRLTSWYAIVPKMDLPTGPYVLSNNTLSQVYRLHDDLNGAFMIPIKPASPASTSFEPLHAAGSFPQSLAVAVPSRLSAAKNSPIQGKRIGVKELFAISGLRMALSNRAFYSIADPAQQTAPAIQRLLDAGAIMVGSTKCSSMISREDPVEAIDFQAPFNPRGDGYQSPVGSSSGSAAAIASYDWLDFTIGSDTTGSSRRPAFVNGCFQHRFSSEALSLEGVRPCFARFDAPALFCRHVGGLADFVGAWCGDNQDLSQNQIPTELIYPVDYLPVSNSIQQELLDAMVRDVATFCQIPIRKISFKDLWSTNPPDDAAGVPMEEYLQDAGRNTFVYDFYHNSDGFLRDYEQKYDRAAFANKVTRWRWDIGSHISHAQRMNAMKRMNVYRDWVLDNILRVKSEIALVVLPIKEAEPNYRDTDPGPPFAQEVWDPLWLSPVLGAPEISVPVGEITYQSRISKRPEQLPVAVSFMGPPGTDAMLARTLKATFEHAKRPLFVNVGSTMYGRGESKGSR